MHKTFIKLSNNKQLHPKNRKKDEQKLPQGRHTGDNKCVGKMFYITNHQKNANQNNDKIPPHIIVTGMHHKEYKQCWWNYEDK